MVLIAVNCSERKKPPTISSTRINDSGVVGVNSAQTARKAALTIASTVMMLRKPKVLIMRAASVFMNSAPTAEPKVIRPGLKRRQAEADLQQQRQQERQRADAEPEQEAADDRRAHCLAAAAG